jgi:hypothetical protein
MKFNGFLMFFQSFFNVCFLTDGSEKYDVPFGDGVPAAAGHLALGGLRRLRDPPQDTSYFSERHSYTISKYLASTGFSKARTQGAETTLLKDCFFRIIQKFRASRHRLMVRTTPSHGVNRGSIPRGGTDLE